jgi:hypothetical protein
MRFAPGQEAGCGQAGYRATARRFSSPDGRRWQEPCFWISFFFVRWAMKPGIWRSRGLKIPGDPYFRKTGQFLTPIRFFSWPILERFRVFRKIAADRLFFIRIVPNILIAAGVFHKSSSFELPIIPNPVFQTGQALFRDLRSEGERILKQGPSCRSSVPPTGGQDSG